MNLFKKKQKKQDGGEWIVKMALQEAMRELQEEREKSKIAQKTSETLTKLNNENQIDAEKKIRNLENNLEVLQNTIENIKELCKDKKVIGAKIILKELGE